jgi:sugar phosphate permease
LLLLTRGLFDGLWMPLSQIYLNRQAPSELRATLLSLQNLASRIGLASVIGAFAFATSQVGLLATFGLAAACAAIVGALLVATASAD